MIVSTNVAVIGASGWNGNWTECGGASWIAVPLFRNTVLLGGWTVLLVLLVAGFTSYLEIIDAWVTLLFLLWFLQIMFYLFQFADECQSTSFWYFCFPALLELTVCIKWNLLKKNYLWKYRKIQHKNLMQYFISHSSLIIV